MASFRVWRYTSAKQKATRTCLAVQLRAAMLRPRFSTWQQNTKTQTCVRGALLTWRRHVQTALRKQAVAFELADAMYRRRIQLTCFQAWVLTWCQEASVVIFLQRSRQTATIAALRAWARLAVHSANCNRAALAIELFVARRVMWTWRTAASTRVGTLDLEQAASSHYSLQLQRRCLHGLAVVVRFLRSSTSPSVPVLLF